MPLRRRGHSIGRASISLRAREHTCHDADDTSFGAHSTQGVQRTLGGLSRALLVGLMAFLTVVDLFATQAILPALTRAYGTTPAMMSFAVNASTIGMAVPDLRCP